MSLNNTQLSNNRTPIHSLCESIEKELLIDIQGPNLLNLLSSYSKKYDDWKSYALYGDAKSCYRNIVFKSDLFIMLVLIWPDNCKFNIHDHPGSLCWFTVLDGELGERFFQITEPSTGDFDEEGQRASPKLKEEGFDWHQTGALGSIDDQKALHAIETKEKIAVSLHVYAPPINRFSIFFPDEGVEKLITPVLFSIDKVPLHSFTKINHLYQEE